jgi:hypothetical protein
MYKIIIKYPPEYKTPIRIEERDVFEEALDLRDEVEQGFGSCIILDEKNYEALKDLITNKGSSKICDIPF